MTYQSLNQIDIADGAHLDAFGRLRVSENTIQFQSFSEYGISSRDWVTTVTSNATITHSTTTKNITLSNGGTITGNSAILQSKKYARYTPGQSLLVNATFVYGTAVSNVYKRVGLYDAGNGFFFEQAGDGTLSFVKRTNTSGATVDTSITQSNWNVDKLDGTGASGKTLDITKGQILFMDYQFLGVGRVRIGFVIDGIDIVAHEFLHSNVLATQPYIATPNLPVRAEIVNNGTAGGTATFAFICGQISVEGQSAVGGYLATAFNTTAISTTTTFKPILSVRLAPTINSITNRGWLLPETVDLLVTSNPHLYAVVLNGTLTGASWLTAGTASQYDVSATAISGGEYLHGGVLGADNQRSGNIVGDILGLATSNNYAGSTPDTITLVARTTTSTGNAWGVINWKEYY